MHRWFDGRGHGRCLVRLIYLGRESCPQAVCARDREAVLRGLRDADADRRVLGVHVLELGAEWEAVAKLGAEFIRDYQGDLVFGHGPQVWKPPTAGGREARRHRSQKGRVQQPWKLHPSNAPRAGPQPDRPRAVRSGDARAPAGPARHRRDRGPQCEPRHDLRLRGRLVRDASEVGSYGTQRIPWRDFDDATGTKPLRGAFVNVP